MSKLELVDNYIKERKTNKDSDILVLLIISVEIMHSTEKAREKYFKDLGGL